MTAIAVRVPESDAADLQALVDSIGCNSELEVAHPFDGETVIQTILVLAPVTYPFFRTWVTNRASQRKNFSIVHNGTELKGYTAAEAEDILTVVAATLLDSEAADDVDAIETGHSNVTEQGTNN